MTELKCPVCKTGVVQIIGFDDYCCSNEFCPSYNENITDTKTYNTLIRTRKALDVAVDALKDFSIHPDNSVKKYAKKVLEQITAEQKDK